jgi:formylmethanofuran dehydrogenase subunit E
MKIYLFIIATVATACSTNKHISFKTIDTDFSKGRLTNEQTVSIKDLEKFHGHLCDGLVVGTLAMKQALIALYPNQPIDRTNLRIVSKPSPCLTDVAIYLTGGRYQFNTFYVDTALEGLYIVQRLDNNQAVSVSLNSGVKPSLIDSLGNLATQKKLSPCGIDSLRVLEDTFTNQLYKADPNKIFTVTKVKDFTWQASTKNTFTKTDILNKEQPKCNK